jgi:cytochrome c-type biogenesis protein CcmH
MILWLVIAVMTAAALALVLVPLVLRHRRAPRRADFDMAIYRDQLDELESDSARGLLSEDQSEAARLEIQRRMLAAAKRGEGEVAIAEGADEGAIAAVGRWHWLLVAGIGAAIPALAVTLYFIVWGSPGMPGQPFSGVAQQGGGAPGQAAGDQKSMDATIANLAQRLEKEPGDIQGWLLLGHSLLTVQRYADSAQAFATAAKLSGNDPEITSMMAEAMVLAAEGMVTPDALKAFESVLAARPDDTAAQYYIGMSLAQRGRPLEALDIWRQLAAQTALDAPWRQELVAMMQGAAEEAGIELGEIASLPASAPQTGPSPEDMAAAAEMSPDEQVEFIRSMVERLAARLAEQPDDVEGWRNLARSYRVLGENEKAAEADRRVAELEGGVAPPPVDSAPVESAGDGAVAGDMSPEEQAQMVANMVEPLAERLRENPEDLQGWIHLARSYSVLGRHEEAYEALDRAVELAPDDTNVLNFYARAVMIGTGEAEQFPERAIRIFARILELEPGHFEALWFMGYAEAAAGRPDGARDYWRRLLALLPADGEDSEAVREAIDTLPN